MSVYFIKPVGMDGPIKIGFSKRPQHRLMTLDQWCPIPLEIVAEVEGDYRIEDRFHRLFLADHQRHEWFTASDLLKATIQQINDGAFRTDSLPRHIGPLRGMQKRIATFTDLDYEYLSSYRDYWDRKDRNGPHGLVHSPVVFSKFTHTKKTRIIAELREFLIKKAEAAA